MLILNNIQSNKYFLFQQSYVEVIHIPIFTISLTNVVFVTPPFRNLQTFFLGELKSDNATVDINNLSKQERNEARRFAASLNNMLDSMNLKEDVYYIGSYSAIIGGILEHYPISIQRRKVHNYVKVLISVSAMYLED